MLARKSLLALSADVLKALFGFASTFFIAHYLGATALGTIGYFLSLVGTLALVSDLGMHQAFRKCASERPDDNGGYVSAFIIAKTVLALLLFCTCLGAPVVSRRLASQLNTAEVRGAYWAIAAFYLFNSFLSIPALTFQARRETAKLTLPTTMASLLSSGAKIIVAVAGASLTALAIAYTLETAIGLMLSLILLWRYPLRRPSRAEIMHLLTYAWPTVVLTGLAYVLQNLDRILVESFWGAAEVGFYTAVLGLVGLMQRVPLAAMTIFFPHASEDAAKGALREIERRLFVVERYLLMITVPLAVGVALSSAQITRLYLGEAFGRSGPMLAVLAFNPVIVAFFEPYNTVIYAVGKHRSLLLSSVLGLVVLLILDTLLVPRSLLSLTMLGLGGIGAALGSLASQAVSGAFQIHLARRFAGVGFYWRAVKFVLAGLGMAAVARSIQQAAPPSLWMTGLAVAVGAAAYLVILSMLQEFRRADAQVLLDVLHPGRMASYVLGELREPASDKRQGNVQH